MSLKYICSRIAAARVNILIYEWFGTKRSFLMGSEKQTVSKNGGRHLKLNIGLIVFIGIFIYLIAIGLSYLMRNHISFL